MQIREAVRAATAALMGSSGAPRRDVEMLLAHVLGKPREYLLAHDDEAIPDLAYRAFEKLLTLRRQGMPLPYLLGTRHFYDRVLKVTSHVLIPRPETETIVEAALEWTRARRNGAARLIDVGTGSGAIAVTLAAHLPDSHVLATDVSAAALLIAAENGAGLMNLHFAQGDLLAPFAARPCFDVICANLPYIAIPDLAILDVAKFEPHVALNGGPDGLDLIRRLLAQAPARLAAPGLILLEMASDHGEAAMALARQSFPAAHIDVLKDLARVDRVLRIALE